MGVRLGGGSGGGPPSGAAGGVLSGTYPNPGFAVDMGTQAELDAVAAAKQDVSTKGVAGGYASLDGSAKVPTAQIPTITAAMVAADMATQAELDAVSASKANTVHTHAAADITSGSFAVARLGTGTPASGKYVDGATGAWTTLPSGGGGVVLETVNAGGSLGVSRTETVPANTIRYLRNGILNANHAFTATMTASSWLELFFAQDATGSRTLSINGTTVPIPTAPNVSFKITIQYDGTDHQIDIAGGGNVPAGAVIGDAPVWDGTSWVSTGVATQAELDAVAAAKANTTHTHAAGDVTAGTFAVARIGSGTAAAGKYVDGGTGAWTTLPAGFTNPMTASGDIIYGGTAGAATALPKGTDGKVLTLAAGLPSWATPSGGSSERPGWLPSDNGYAGAAFDVAMSTGSSALASNGLLYLTKIYVPTSVTLTTLYVSLGGLGASLTSGQNFGCLFSSAGVLLAKTAEQVNTDWGSAGIVALKPMTLTAEAGQTLTQGGAGVWLYGGVYSNATTRPTFTRIPGTTVTTVNANLTATTYRSATAAGPYTTAPPSTLPALSSSGIMFWMAVS